MNSPPDRGFVLIAALSGRALAAAARRAGYKPLVADLFGDLDTQAIAAASVRVPGRLSRGFRRDGLLSALDALAASTAPAGLAYGAGFEDRPTLLKALAERYGLLGNSAATVRKVKRPDALAALCRRQGVPHPLTRHGDAGEGAWFEKRAGGSGGGHVRPATRAPTGARYLQQRLPGRAVSAMVLANGTQSMLLGFSEQWTNPAPGQPFRYGGAVRPAAVSSPLAAGMADAIGRIVPEAGLAGLISADFLLDDDGFHLLEINPRPGATLDVFRDSADMLFRFHVEACRGTLPGQTPSFGRPNAAAVVYARRRIVLPPDFEWPEWTADWQPPGKPVPAGAALCTVLAEAETADQARHGVAQRAAMVLDYVESIV